MSSSINSVNVKAIYVVPVPSWISRLQEDQKVEDGYNSIMLLRLATMRVRNYIWKFSRELIGAHRARNGTSSQACRIFERYLAAYIIDDRSSSDSAWNLRKEELVKRVPLLIGVSLMMASKMESAVDHIVADDLVAALLRQGRSYKRKDIYEAEIELFAAIKCAVPLWSNVQKVQMFCAQIGACERARARAAARMDVVDAALPVLFALVAAHLRPTPGHLRPAFIRISDDQIYVKNIHLVLAVVLASCEQPAGEGPLAGTLARWTGTPVSYLRWLSKIVALFCNTQVAALAAAGDKRLRDSEDTSSDDANAAKRFHSSH